MKTSIKPVVVFLCYTHGAGLRYHLADWLIELVNQSEEEFEIVGLSEPQEEEPGLFERLKNYEATNLRIAHSLSDPIAVDTLSRAAVVHCHGFRQLAELYKLRLSIGATYRCVLSLHYFRNGTLLKIPFANYVSGFLLNKAAHTLHFLSTRSHAEFINSNILLKQKMPYYIFPLGCDEREFSNKDHMDQPEEWDYHKLLDAGRPNIVYLANFFRSKKHRWLIDALTTLLLRRNVLLWLLGDGPERQNVMDYVKKKSLIDHVIFPGRVQRRYIPWLLSRMQVAVCPSLSENSPHSIMEPLFVGVPVVTFDVGTASQLVSDFSRGFVLGQPRVKEEFARKVDVILGNPQLQKRMAGEAKHFVSQFYTWRVCAENCLAMYRTMLP